MLVAVTGAGGFIGRALSALLTEKGHEVIEVDRSFPEGRACGRSRFRADLSLPGSCGALSGADAVFHLASNSDIRAGMADPMLDLRDTYLTTRNVLDAAEEFGIGKILFASSSAVYGTNGCGASETSRLTPVSNYGRFKAVSEAEVIERSSSEGPRSVILRMSNVVGPGQTRGVVPDFIGRLLSDPGHLDILGDGNQSKQYIHLDDALEAMCHFMGDPGPGASVYNISPPTAISVREVADLVCGAMGLRDVRYRFSGGAAGWPGDVPRYCLDASKAKAHGWTCGRDSREAVSCAARALFGSRAAARFIGPASMRCP
ncbi:MAG: NAD-dependent epimerase/dehydratase family protein [Gudongella sp.]|nr:NAD-dependent epimerase/dehydratase family protein [Gudongella sp.]